MASLDQNLSARVTSPAISEHPTGPSLVAMCAAGAIVVGMVVFLWVV